VEFVSEIFQPVGRFGLQVASGAFAFMARGDAQVHLQLKYWSNFCKKIVELL
jgi:hypothetical protein